MTTVHERSATGSYCAGCWGDWPCPTAGGVLPCPHGMPTPGSCVECMADGNLTPPQPKAVIPDGDPFTARFGGECPDCNLPITAGQMIIRWSDGRYRHTRCTP